MWFSAQWRNGLLPRVLALTLVLVLVTGAMVGGIFVVALRSVSLQQMELRSAAVVKSLGARAQFPMLVGDTAQLRQLAQEALSNEDVLFVVVADKGGDTLRLARPNFPGDELPLNATWDQTGQLAVRRSAGRNGALDYLEAQWIVQPPDARDLLGMEDGARKPKTAIGALRIGISLEQPRAAVFSATVKALLSASLCIAFILALESRRLRRLLAPLRRLADFTASVGQENLARRAETAGVGEISDLAMAFNGMLDRLAATLVSKQLAEQANLAKSRFLANAGHELRTPLNAVIGYSELLEEECAERGLRDLLPDLGKIRNAGRMLLDLMNDLLDYSKSEAGKLQLKAESVLIADVIEEVAATVAPMARQNGNRLAIERPDGDLLVRADRGRFRQSLLNLASNACKFTEHGTITIGAARSSQGEREYCEIHVRDSGIGIAPDEIGKLFEAFVQVDSSATRKHGGTGLGLAISRRFCRMMGGDIRVTSQLGQGSVFTISLPAASPLAQEPPELAEMTSEAERG